MRSEWLLSLALCAAPCLTAPSLAAQETQWIRSSAVAKPASVVQIRARVDGHVRRRTVEVGATVKAGDVLVELAAPELKVAIEQAAAALALADSQRELREVDLAIAKKELGIAQRHRRIAADDVPKTQRILAARRAALERADALHKTGATTSAHVRTAQVDLAEAEAAFATAGERFKNSEDEIAIAELKVRARELRIEAATATVAERRAQLKAAEIRAAQAVLRCPVDGLLVTRVLLDVGDLARAGESTLVELMDVSRLRFATHVPQSKAHLVKVGTRARVRQRQDGTGAVLTTRVHSRSGRIDPTTGTMQVEVEIPSDGGSWMPGMYCVVELELAAK